MMNTSFQCYDIKLKRKIDPRYIHDCLEELQLELALLIGQHSVASPLPMAYGYSPLACAFRAE